MEIVVIACGVFQPELDIVLPKLCRSEFAGHHIRVEYLEMALHNDIKKLKQQVGEALEKHKSDRVALLFGSICHPELKDICAQYSVKTPPHKNCIDMFVSDPEKEQLAQDSEVFFLTHGWFTNWKNSLVASGWDTYDARMNFGRYDSFLLLDSGITEYTDEALIDFFEYTTVPIEIEPITLYRFEVVVRELLAPLLQS